MNMNFKLLEMCVKLLILVIRAWNIFLLVICLMVLFFISKSCGSVHLNVMVSL